MGIYYYINGIYSYIMGEHHGMGVYQINHFVAIWWFYYMLLYVYIYTPLYSDLYTWVNKQLDDISCPRYPRLAILCTWTAVQLFSFFSMGLAEIPPKLGFMDVYGEYIYVLKMVQLDALQMVENAKSQQGGPCIGLAVWRMNFVGHVHLQWSSQLKTIWFEVIETETSQDSHVIK